MASSSISQPKREMKVLCLGLPRSGSLSMATALEMLGYKNPHHGMKVLLDGKDWEHLGLASDGCFPTLPSYTGKRFTREDWDELFGTREVVTDCGSCFATQLIDAYPNAKVVLVIRDFDKWVSVGQFAEQMVGGYFEANDKDGIMKNARRIYDKHHRQIREMVPPERLLVYKLTDSWEPLCKFLGKPVPNVEFPRTNEREGFLEKLGKRDIELWMMAFKALTPWAIGAAGVGFGLWTVARSGNFSSLWEQRLG